MGKRLSNNTFVDMMIQIEAEKEIIQNSKTKIKKIYDIYGLGKPGYNVRKSLTLENITLKQLIKKTNG